MFCSRELTFYSCELMFGVSRQEEIDMALSVSARKMAAGGLWVGVREASVDTVSVAGGWVVTCWRVAS